MILESGANVSDHMPPVYSFQFANSISVSKLDATCSKNRYHSWRWDKANLGYYYNCSYQCLSYIIVPSSCDKCRLVVVIGCQLKIWVKKMIIVLNSLFSPLFAKHFKMYIIDLLWIVKLLMNFCVTERKGCLIVLYRITNA